MLQIKVKIARVNNPGLQASYVKLNNKTPIQFICKCKYECALNILLNYIIDKTCLAKSLLDWFTYFIRS